MPKNVQEKVRTLKKHETYLFNGVIMLNHTFSDKDKEIAAGTIKKEGDIDNDFPTLEDAFRKC